MIFLSNSLGYVALAAKLYFEPNQGTKLIVRCIKCKVQFEQKRNERHCGNHNAKNNPQVLKKYNREHPEYIYIFTQRKHFQDPIYQFYRIFNDEYIPNIKKIKDVWFYSSLL